MLVRIHLILCYAELAGYGNICSAIDRMQLIVAEKPSVARDLARVLGVTTARRHWIEGAGRVITWCVGHLVELDEPAAYDARWKPWRLDTLPMLPDEFRLRPVAATRDQLDAVTQLLGERRFREVVNACDAGREGELIFRNVYRLAGARLPVRRLWISSLTDEAIGDGFARLRPGAELDALADAARARAEADWLVGLNATRALTVRRRAAGDDALYSIGRVQTPTLAMLVAREQAIRAFVPTDYWEVEGDFGFPATWRYGGRARLAASPLADAIVARATAEGAGTVESLTRRAVREPPPLLFDLTSLQRTANRRFGFSAGRTLELAQSLYERHKVLSYPRTASRHLGSDLIAELPSLWRALAAVDDYAPFAERLLAHPPAPPKRVFDDAKVQDHHAIIPTTRARPGHLDGDERRLFDLVARRFLGAFFPDAEIELTDVVVCVGAPSRNDNIEKKNDDKSIKNNDSVNHNAPSENEELVRDLPAPPDRFHARGRVRRAAGWQEVAGLDEPADLPPLPALTEGQRLIGRFAARAKKTAPPRRHSDATLLAAMESAGRGVEDEAHRRAMKDRGLGTPATRAATIETLIARGFVARDKKLLVPTEMGIALVERLPVESLRSAELTGAWEARLARVARGEEARGAFMRDIERFVREVVAAICAAPVAPITREAQPMARRTTRPIERSTKATVNRAAKTIANKTTKPIEKKTARPIEKKTARLICPLCRRGAVVRGQHNWGCERWRDGCAFLVCSDGLSDAQLRELVREGETRDGRLTMRPNGALKRRD
jgi:DNA topoisomerase-3